MSSGFALVVVLSLMVLLTIIAVGLLTLGSVSLRTSTQGQAMAQARANARMALMLAIGDLQKSAGPDRRVTAAADILPASKPAAESRAHWAGVWDTSAFNPAKPDTKAFVRWLVSDSPSSVADATAAPGTDDVLLFTGKDAASSVKVPKIKVTDTTSKGRYAYWVSDEGLKADLGWGEGSNTTGERKQMARLAAAPGPDYGSLGGPFTPGKTNYPITGATGNPWLDNLDKALSAADMPLVMGDPGNQSAWLRSMRHDITLGSRGVLADVKKGGLRRDLSLAFEMDGAAESPATPNFNAQTSEFVGNGDQLSAPRKPAGLPVNERFLYRDMRSFSNPFSSDIVQAKTWSTGTGTNNAVMRGPNWWALRDYANLYKRLTGTVGDYTLKARPYFPNRDTEGISYSDLFDIAGPWGEHWVAEERVKHMNPLAGQSVYIYRPARASYAPVNLGLTVLTSAQNRNGKLAIVLDPIVYLWNPYNRKIKFDSLRVVLDKSFPGAYRIRRQAASPAAVTSYEDGFTETIYQTFGNKVWGLNFTIRETAAGGSMTMNPGEVMVVTPTSASNPTSPDFQGTPGYFTTGVNSTGIVMTKFKNSATGQYEEVSINSGDGFSCSYLADVAGSGAGERFDIDTNLPNPNNATQWLQTQNWHMQVTVKGNAWAELEKVQASPPSTPLTTSKQFFGLYVELMKPALFGPANANPVEVFSRFNPAPLLIHKDFWRACTLNQTWRSIGDTGNNLLTNYGIGFSGSPRNTFWGASYESTTGSTSVPASNIPSTPLISLVEFSHANLSLMASDPFHAVGNSWSNPIIPPSSAYGRVITTGGSTKDSLTAADHSWLMNDALFDRYYLTGLAPDYKISAGGYSASGTLKDTVAKFFSTDYQSAKASPVMRPYLPPGDTADAVVNALIASDGYKKAGAYSLIDGVFNVNSTSIPAWTALLRANRNLAVTHAQGGTDSKDGSPFPRSSSPTAPGNGAQTYWSGFTRLTDAQIDSLATEIVKQVKLRGPFMSISDFINHKMGPIDAAKSYTGALQAAIDSTTINNSVRSGAGGTNPDTSAGAKTYMPGMPPADGRKTTTGIPTDITQADLLLPLAPRITARSDTFRIRGYGEARSKDGTQVLASATCEAVVQRYPEYVDPSTDAANNEPWDEGAGLNVINKTFGRRLNVVSFRWLNPNEI